MYGMDSHDINVQVVTSSYNAPVVKFLKFYRSRRGGTRSHTSIKPYKSAGGSWDLPEEKYSDFYDLYAKDIESGIELHLTEVPGEKSPIKVDIDMKWDSPTLERLYDDEFVVNLIEVYYKVFSEIIVYQDDLEKRAFIFEKSGPRRSGKHVNENKLN